MVFCLGTEGSNGSLFRHEIGRAHVWTPVTRPDLVCRLLLEKKKNNKKYALHIQNPKFKVINGTYNLKSSNQVEKQRSSKLNEVAVIEEYTTRTNRHDHKSTEDHTINNNTD